VYKILENKHYRLAIEIVFFGFVVVKDGKVVQVSQRYQRRQEYTLKKLT
jgi:hypothetical protein